MERLQFLRSILLAPFNCHGDMNRPASPHWSPGLKIRHFHSLASLSSPDPLLHRNRPSRSCSKWENKRRKTNESERMRHYRAAGKEFSSLLPSLLNEAPKAHSLTRFHRILLYYAASGTSSASRQRQKPCSACRLGTASLALWLSGR
jgi:hypothetical protein